MRLSRPDRPVRAPAQAAVGRLGADGRPRGIMVLAEYPLGYGFGDTARTPVTLTLPRWPPNDDMAWRYLVVNMRPPATPPSPPS